MHFSMCDYYSTQYLPRNLRVPPKQGPRAGKTLLSSRSRRAIHCYLQGPQKMKGTSIFCKVIHKHESKPKVVNARVRQIASVRRSSPEFSRFMSTGHKAVALQTTLKTELRGHCKIPDNKHWRLSARWKNRKYRVLRLSRTLPKE